MQQPGTYDTQPLRLADYARMARRWWWVLLLVPLLSAGITYLLRSAQAPSYATTAQLYVVAPSTTSNDVTAARLLTKSYGELVTSRLVLERVIAKLQLPYSAADLAPKIDTSVTLDTQIIDVTAQDPNPQVAADLANTTSSEFVGWLAETQAAASSQTQDALRQSIDDTQTSIETINAQAAALRAQQDLSAAESAQLAGLEASLRQYQTQYDNLQRLEQTQSFTPQISVQIPSPAPVPPVTSNLIALRDAALAFVLGLALAAIGVVLFERTANRLYQGDDVYRRVGVPVLGGVPRARGRSKLAMVDAPQASMSEAIRSLRTTLQFATGERGLGTLVVTSPEASSGKSIVAANLAAALAQTGQRVILVDADLRHPQQHELFGVQNNDGLAKLLTHTAAQPEYAVVRHSQIESLYLLVAGTPNTSASELLASKRFQRVIGDLRRIADVVVVDAAPVLPFSDALLVAAEAEHVVVTVESGRTQAGTLQSALATLQQTGAAVLGVVLHGSSDLGGTGTPAFSPRVSGQLAPAQDDRRGMTTRLAPETEYDRA